MERAKKRTPVTLEQFVPALRARWFLRFGSMPEVVDVCALFGKMTIECGWAPLKGPWWFNVGNVRASEKRPHYALTKAHEYVPAGKVPKGWRVVPNPPGHIQPPGTVPVLPDNPAINRFAAYDSLDDGLDAYLATLAESFPSVLAELLEDGTDPSELVDAMKADDYFTGDVSAYRSGVVQIAAQVRKRVEALIADVPSPSSAPVTQPQTPASRSAPRMAAVRLSTPPPVHLPAPRGGVLRGNPWGHAYALTEAPPATDALSVIRWLAVERSPRYRPQPGVTYCNVFASDTARAMGAYLPRVFWLEPAIAAFARGETRSPSIEAPATVGELSANALYRWLVRWGSTYGWERLTNLDDAQDAANAGRCVVLCARRTDERQPGHIGLVAPESDACRALRGESGAVLLPVQSMAGSTLLELGHGKAWWRGAEFAEWGAWANSSGSPNSSPGVADGRTQPLWETVEGEHTVAPEEPEL